MMKRISKTFIKLKKHNNITRINYSDLLATFIIYILTFPHLEPDYSIGLDTSYAWGLNYLFNHGYLALREIIYPYGPLAFLKIPTIESYNFEFFLLFYTILKMWFTYMFITVTEQFNQDRKIISYLVITIALLFFNVDYLIIGITFIYSFLYLNNRRFIYVIIPISAAFIGLCIKSSIGISCFSIVFTTLLLDYFKNRSLQSTLKFSGLAFCCILIWGLLIFQHIELLFYYLISVLRLSIGYSSALSIFPPNNWALLSLFILSVLLPIFINRSIKTRTVFLLLLPSLIAMWKHATTRQDFTHMMIMFNFLFLYWALFVAISEIEIKRLLFIASVSTSLFYSNMVNTWNFQPKTIEVNGIVNFEKIVLNFKDFKNEYAVKSEKSIQASKLDKTILDSIGNSTIDSYPWELSYFAANKDLNWKMRRTLQSGSFSQWLDACNAQDFSRQNGPKFIILHYVKDKWGGNFGSMDERYLLNDNPLTIDNIFNYYSVKLKTHNFLLLRKNNKDNFISRETGRKITTEWNKWIDVKQKEREIVRLKLLSNQSLLGWLKSFLYKPDKYYVDYKLADGKIFTYRYIPANAEDGIWINPLIRHPENCQLENQPVKVRFRCTNSLFNKKEITYQVENIQTNNSIAMGGVQRSDFNSYFNKYILIKENTILNYLIDFDSVQDDINADISTSFAFSGNGSNKVIGGGDSYAYSVILDTLWENVDTIYNTVTVETDVKYFNQKSNAVHVVSLSGSNKDFWNGSYLNKNATNNFWDNSLQIQKINRKLHGKGTLKIYVWNNGKEDIYIDELRVVMKTIANNAYKK